MSLNNAKKSQFMLRTASYSTRGSRTGANLLGWEEPENMTAEQVLNSMKAHYTRLIDICKALPKDSKQRSDMGQEMQKFAQRLRVQKAKAKKERMSDINEYIALIFKSRVSRIQWEKILDEAEEMLKKETERVDAEIENECQKLSA